MGGRGVTSSNTFENALLETATENALSQHALAAAIGPDHEIVAYFQSRRWLCLAPSIAPTFRQSPQLCYGH